MRSPDVSRNLAASSEYTRTSRSWASDSVLWLLRTAEPRRACAVHIMFTCTCVDVWAAVSTSKWSSQSSALALSPPHAHTHTQKTTQKITCSRTQRSSTSTGVNTHPTTLRRRRERDVGGRSGAGTGDRAGPNHLCRDRRFQHDVPVLLWRGVQQPGLPEHHRQARSRRHRCR